MRRAVLICFALALPCAVRAQQRTGTDLGPVTNTLAAQAGLYVRWLTAAFDSIPANKYDYKPTAPQQSIGYIAQHLENANYRLCAQFAGLPYHMTAKDSLADTIKAKWPKDTLIARLKASIDFCRTAFLTLSDAKLADSTDAIPGTQPGGRFPRARWVVLFVTDLADHWAQIANYMRLLGMVPPSAQR